MLIGVKPNVSYALNVFGFRDTSVVRVTRRLNVFYVELGRSMCG